MQANFFKNKIAITYLIKNKFLFNINTRGILWIKKKHLVKESVNSENTIN